MKFELPDGIFKFFEDFNRNIYTNNIINYFNIYDK